MPSIHVECRPDHSDFSPRMFAAKKTELLHLNLSQAGQAAQQPACR